MTKCRLFRSHTTPRASLALAAAIWLFAISAPAIGQSDAPTSADEARQSESQASADDTQRPEPLAIIGAEAVTEADVERLLANRGRSFADVPVSERRRAALESLVAERMLLNRYDEVRNELSEPVQAALASAGGQIMVDFFARSRFQPEEPTQAEIDAFIAANPHLFEARHTYRFQIVTVGFDNAAEREAAEAVFAPLERAPGAPAPRVGAMTEAMAALSEAGLNPAISSEWRPSEAITEGLRTRIEAMRRAGETTLLERDEGTLEFIVLHAADPTPVAAAQLRERVRDRLIGEQFVEHRREIISQLAASPIQRAEQFVAASAEGAQAPAETPAEPEAAETLPTQKAIGMALLGAVAAGLAAALFTAVSWLWLIIEKARVQRKLGSRVRGIRTPRLAAGISLGAAALAMLAGYFSVNAVWAVYAPNTLAAVIAGALALGAVLGWLLRRMSRADESVLESRRYARYAKSGLSTAQQLTIAHRSQPLLYALLGATAVCALATLILITGVTP
ncbi:hypothetical protein V6X63_10125 [Spiribacter sp. 221]|uniref:hypothetical protein n=1 Tax=Spiribacter onubensis TaxID=3122420 RepID=UPI00349F4714